MTLQLYKEKINNFMNACISPDVKNIHAFIDDIKVNKKQKNEIICAGFYLACQHSKINNINALSSYQAVEEYCKDKKNLNNILTYAILDWKEYFLKFLLTNKLFKHIDIHWENERILKKAIKRKNIHFIKFLLNEDKVTSHSNIYTKGNEILIKLIDDNDTAMLKGLIEQCNIKIHKKVQEYAQKSYEEDSSYRHIHSLIKKQQLILLKENLETNLTNNNQTVKKRKI